MAFKLKANRAAVVVALLAGASWASVHAAGTLPGMTGVQGATIPSLGMPAIESVLDMVEQLDRTQLQNELGRLSAQQRAAFRDAFASMSDDELHSVLKGRDITDLREKLRGQGIEHVLKRGADSLAAAEQAEAQARPDAHGQADPAKRVGAAPENKKDTRTREQRMADRMKDLHRQNQAAASLGVLYAAVPGAVLGLGDAMLETAMGAPSRADATTDKSVWGRLSVAGARPVVASGLKAPAGGFSSDARLQVNTLTAQFGTPVYRSDTTRLDATFGFGARNTQLSPNRKKDPDLNTFSASLGANLVHRAPADIDLRLGAQLYGGGSVLKGPGMGRLGRDFEEKFKHFGMGVRAEASRDFAIGRGVVVTPLAGIGASTAWAKQSNTGTDNNSAVSAWASARLAYNHAMQTGRSASFWVEPTYIGQLKRSTTITAAFYDVKFDVTSRLPRDRVGVRLGMELPVGKLASFQASMSRFWGVGNSRQQDGALNLGYVHRF